MSREEERSQLEVGEEEGSQEIRVSQQPRGKHVQEEDRDWPLAAASGGHWWPC